MSAQVSECIRLLQSDSNVPIQRARMRVRVTVPASDSQRLREGIVKSGDKIEREETHEQEWEVVGRFSASRLSDRPVIDHAH